jgi:hypothetical protein
MSMRYQAAILTASYIPLKTPSAPTIGTASAATGTSISVTFTAPSNIGGGAITAYYAIATDSSTGANFSATAASSPITVTGLTNNSTYTLKVYAVNAYGNGPLSTASNSVGLTLEYYTTFGTYTFTVPTGVTSISVAAIGGGGGGHGGPSSPGGGGGGGAFRYVNSVAATPGATYTVTVGAAGTSSNSPTNGGQSSFGSVVVAPGGIAASGGSGGAGGSGGTGSGGNGGIGASSGGSYGGGWQGGGGAGGAGGRNSTGGGGTSASLGNAPYDQTRNGSTSGGSGGFGGGTNGYSGGGVFFDTANIGTTTAYSQNNMPLGTTFNFTPSAGFFGQGGGGSSGDVSGSPRLAGNGAVAVRWAGLTF